MNFTDNCTLLEEKDCKDAILESFSRFKGAQIKRDLHVDFLMNSLHGPLSQGYVSLDASRPWLFYWTLRSLSLLNALPEAGSKMHSLCVKELVDLQHPLGGFCGNQGHLPHLAATYAACAALFLLKSQQKIDQRSMQQFLGRLKQKDSGAFLIQEQGGEDDLRALYCAAAVAKMCNLATDKDLFDDRYFQRIQQCQTYEGGLGAVPFAEAHGGYTFCGVAALAILGRPECIDLNKLLSFCQAMQCQQTGGLRGRTNKLVDGCYSYWQAAAACLAATSIGEDLRTVINWQGLKRFILEACQDGGRGGLRDKPGKPADLYHTCYCLSGLELCNIVLSDMTTSSSSDDSFMNALCLNI